MNDLTIRIPAVVKEIAAEVQKIGFEMSCDAQTGSLLKTLAATKPNSRFLELGTGAGISTSWLLAGMDATSSLATVDNDPELHSIAKRHLGSDSRVAFETVDGGAFIEQNKERKFDFIFADTWPGKFYLLEETLRMVDKPGSLFIIDDLSPVDSWPAEHAQNVKDLIHYMENLDGFSIAKLSWSTGLIIGAKL